MPYLGFRVRDDSTGAPLGTFRRRRTLILGTVARGAGGPGAGLHVMLVDPDPDVPRHRAPTDERGRYVIHVPEKRSRSAVTLAVRHASGVARVEVADVVPRRIHVAPRIVVP
ncbi:hypothetical protein [Sorangium sp. So ce1024]|uniref:hypothetical protein n=1 Tax=unclassified Sorangium TaxID=2621164 RepID=UPI003F085A66